jgi:peptidyl-tRNA hydrolase, PTH1 family
LYLIAGLGNPGQTYANNRHNIGFMFIDVLTNALDMSAPKQRFQSQAWEGDVMTPAGAEKLLVLKPQTFMNLSGLAVGAAVQFYKLKPEQVFVFHDELDLAPGRFRLKQGGGHAGHNGIRSIMTQIGPNFVRARLGIGHPGDKALVHQWVLSDFTKSDKIWIESLTRACVKAIPLLFSGDQDKYQNEVMRLAPAPKIDPINRVILTVQDLS